MYYFNFLIKSAFGAKFRESFWIRLHFFNETNISIIKKIIDIGMNLNLNVIAEGIETEEQLKVLVEQNCGYGQGYLFSKPLSTKNFEKILRDADSLINEKISTI